MGTALSVQMRHQPAYTVARVTLAPNESIQLESGAMVAMSEGVTLTSKMEGGLLKSLKRAVLSGDSFFISTLTAGPAGGWVDLAPGLPGDIVMVESTPDTAWILTRKAWLASSPSVVMDAKWGGFKTLIGGEGGFLVHAQGEGSIMVTCYGALDMIDLAAGEKIVLDSGHLVAIQTTVSFSLRKAAEGWMNTLKSGEGFVFEITGPGRVYSQSRNPTWFQQFAMSTHSH